VVVTDWDPCRAAVVCACWTCSVTAVALAGVRTEACAAVGSATSAPVMATAGATLTAVSATFSTATEWCADPNA